MNRITVEKIEGTNAFADSREAWQTLFAEAKVSPFLSWEWLSTWHKWFGANRSPLILKAYREDRLIGLLPLCRQTEKFFGMRIERLGFLGEAVGGADYLDLIAKREDKTEVLAAMFDFLQNDAKFDLIALENIAENSTTVDFLRDLSSRDKRKLRYALSTTAVCPRINLGGDWGKLLSEMPRAREFKRKLRKLEKASDFEFRTVTRADEAEAAFERFIEFHEKRWQSRGGSEVTSHPQLLNFHREAVKVLADAGFLRFEEIWFEGACRAAIYGLEANGVFYLYNTGFDQKYAKQSPGFVLIGHSIEQAIGRGIETYDFLRGDEVYKFDWANAKTNLVEINLARRTIPANAHGFLKRTRKEIRRFSKDVLPPDFAERLKTIKRKWKRKKQLSNLTVENSGEIV